MNMPRLTSMRSSRQLKRLLSIAWLDSISFALILSLTATSATEIGGTYDVFVSIDGGTEVQIANDFALTPRAIPDGPDAEGTAPGDDTRPAFAISRGGSSASPFYDDISITAVAAVPEPCDRPRCRRVRCAVGSPQSSVVKGFSSPGWPGGGQCTYFTSKSAYIESE